MRKTYKFTYALAAIFAVIVFILTSFAAGGARHARAATVATTNYEQSNVLDDLKGSTIEGKPFSLEEFGFDKNKRTQLLSFIEFCYSYDKTNQQDFGLYIYVYNPQGINYVTNSSLNKISLRFGGNESLNYYKYNLQFLNKSTDPHYEGLFYKFKIVLPDSWRIYLLNEVNSAERIYEVSEIELLISGNANATAYGTGGKYIYTGFAAGYGNPGAESTLDCEVTDTETLTLDVRHTFYRSKTSDVGPNHQVQLDSVYFSVPKEMFEKYGKLQRIKAEWYEYQTRDIAVTSNEAFYKQVIQYMGTPVGNAYNSNIHYGLISYMCQQNATALHAAELMNLTAWNYIVDYGKLQPVGGKYEVIDTLYWLFYTGDVDIGKYDPYADIVSSGGTETNKLTEYIFNYNKTFENGTLDVKDGTISADLFATDIDENRKVDNEFGKIQKGYSYYDFDADTDLQTLKSYRSGNHDFWENALMYGFWKALIGNYSKEEHTETLPPIQVLTDEDVAGTTDSDKKAISDNLNINYGDVDDLQKYYAEAKAKDEYVVLFRFATTDYYSRTMHISWDEIATLADANTIRGQAYIARETVFLDFDIIQLAFARDGKFVVIGVVMSPIDIIDPITPPYASFTPSDWWKYAIGISVALGVFYVGYIVVRIAIKKYKNGDFTW